MLEPGTLPRASGLPLWAFLGCFICTIVNLFIVRTSLQAASVQLAVPQRTASLPRPNQYIGLETVNRTGAGFAAPKPLVNHPPILTQVSSVNKNFVFPDEPHRWFSWVGTVSPDDRHFLVSKEASTLFSLS
jgi:hypothetical protein